MIIAAFMAVVCALVITIRTFTIKKNFDQLVETSVETSEGYDRTFINMVKRMERELAQRVQFGYTGGKDPMTGQERKVVRPTKPTPSTSTRRTTPAPSPKAAEDEVRLTAIVFDDEQKKYTAVVMVGDRSYSVEVNDTVHGRRVTRITKENLYMQDDKYYYRYDIYGKSARQKR
jgi:hypothetical protein